MAKEIWTLGHPSRRRFFQYEGSVETGVILGLGGRPRVSARFFKVILEHFSGKTVPGGFNMTAPTPGGLGIWVQAHSRTLNGRRLSSRHASFIAAILFHEGYINAYRKGQAVFLEFAKQLPLPTMDRKLSDIAPPRPREA